MLDEIFQDDSVEATNFLTKEVYKIKMKGGDKLVYKFVRTNKGMFYSYKINDGDFIQPDCSDLAVNNEVLRLYKRLRDRSVDNNNNKQVNLRRPAFKIVEGGKK